MNVPELRFKEFSESWTEKKVSEFTNKVGSGSTPLGGEKVYQSSGIPFIRSQNVNNDRLSFEDIAFIPEQINSQMKGSVVKPDDILLNITGASIGRSCVVPTDFETGNVNQHVCIVRLKNDYSSRFLQPYLSSSRGQKLILSTQVGSGREGLNFESIRSFKIFIPKIEEQTKIANFLSAVDEKIAHLSRKCELLAQYKKGVMQQIFSQQLRFQDDDGKDFPEWKSSKLGDISVFLDGKRKPIKESDRAKIKGKYPYYGASGVIDYINDYLFDEEIILLGEDGENIVSRNLPLAFKVTGKCWVNNHAHVIRPDSDQNIDFVTQCLENISYIQYNTGTAQPKLNQEICKQINLKIPSFKEQTKIANFLTAIDDKINHAQAQLAAVKHYKQGLLQQMFV